MTIVNRILATCFVTTFLLAVTPAAMALEKEVLPFWEIVSCPDEDVEIEGKVTFQTHWVENSGHSTWVFQAFWRGHALGLDSGAKYLLSGKWMEIVQESPPFIFLWNDHFQLVSKGSAPNYRFYNKVRFVVDANGEVVVDFEDANEPCSVVDFGIG